MDGVWLSQKSGDRSKSAPAHHRLFDVDVLACRRSLGHHLVVKEWRDDDIDRIHALLASGSRRSSGQCASGPCADKTRRESGSAHLTQLGKRVATTASVRNGGQVCGPHRLGPGRSRGRASKRRPPRRPPPRGPGRCRSNRPRSPVRSVPVRCGGMAPPRATLHPRAQCATTCSPSRASRLCGKSPPLSCVLPRSALASMLARAVRTHRLTRGPERTRPSYHHQAAARACTRAPAAGASVGADA